MKLKNFLFGLLALSLISANFALAQTQLCQPESTECVIPNDLGVGHDINVMGDIAFKSAKGSVFTLKRWSTEVTAMSGSTSSATNLIPAGSVVLGCATRVTTLITSAAATSFSIGDGSDADKWGATIAFAAGTTTGAANFTSAANAAVYTSATSVVLTPNTGTFTAGAVRVECYGYNLTGPTS